ncbi:MAG: hypothetical protein ACI9Y1_002832 [Lentisphaeria bacterium]|jgi:hypothetical protein
MEEKILSSFVPSQIMSQSGWNFKKSWQGTLDLSVWLKASLKKEGRLYLFLEYQDREGKRSIPVDRCMSGGSQSLLLNGRVNMSGSGPLEVFQVKVKYEGCSTPVVAEELTVKFLGETSGAKTLRVAV